MPDIVTPLASASTGSGAATSANVQSCDLNPRVVRVGVWVRPWVSTNPCLFSLWVCLRLRTWSFCWGWLASFFISVAQLYNIPPRESQQRLETPIFGFWLVRLPLRLPHSRFGRWTFCIDCNLGVYLCFQFWLNSHEKALAGTESRDTRGDRKNCAQLRPHYAPTAPTSQSSGGRSRALSRGPT